MSHAVVDPDRDRLIQCPYDPVHMISQMRFPYHLIKCRKNHNGKEYRQCPFDAKHVIIRKDFEDHVRDCDKRTIIERQLVLDDERSEAITIPASKCREIEETLSNDWDTEAPTTAMLRTHRLVTQTVHNTFSSMDHVEDDYAQPRPPNSLNGGQKSSYTSYGQPQSYGRGRGVSKANTNFPVTNAQVGPSSYRIEKIDSYNPPQIPSCGRGRVQYYAGEPNLRRPGQAFTSGTSMRDELEKEKFKLHKKIREITALEERRNNGEELEKNQLDKMSLLLKYQADLHTIVKQLENL